MRSSRGTRKLAARSSGKHEGERGGHLSSMCRRKKRRVCKTRKLLMGDAEGKIKVNPKGPPIDVAGKRGRYRAGAMKGEIQSKSTNGKHINEEKRGRRTFADWRRFELFLKGRKKRERDDRQGIRKNSIEGPSIWREQMRRALRGEKKTPPV